MPELMTRRRRTHAVVAALAGMGLLAACGGGHHRTAPPASGQASVLTEVTGGGAVERAVAAGSGGGEPNGITSASNGSLYLAVPPYVAVVAAKGRIIAAATAPAPAPGAAGTSPQGVVGLPDNSFVTAMDGQLLRIAPGQRPAVLAGVKGRTRSLSDPVPAAGDADTMRFTGYLAPVGTLGDGSLAVADGDAVWRLRLGRLTRLYQRPAVKQAGGDQPSVLGSAVAVSPAGTLFLLPAGSRTALKDAVEVSPAGTAGPLGLPASVDGVPGAPGDLTAVWQTTDGGDGIYVHATSGSHGYVLHVHDGKAELVAASDATSDGCKANQPTDATKFPCPLPWAITYQPGLLVMAGGAPYVVGVPIPKA